jgi:hypothetical protein
MSIGERRRCLISSPGSSDRYLGDGVIGCMSSRVRWRTPLKRTVTRKTASPAARARRKFLRFFPGGFHDETYLDWERDYKWETHQRWEEVLNRRAFHRMMKAGEFEAIAAAALRVEQRSRHSMLFSFEKMALRDGVRTPEGSRAFAEGLFELLHGNGSVAERFASWIERLDSLPRKKTRVLTWPAATVFAFIAQPDRHIFFKPVVTKKAAAAYGCGLPYESRPTWPIYASLLEFAGQIRADLADLRPRDMIDLQSFLWVQGSDEYE